MLPSCKTSRVQDLFNPENSVAFQQFFNGFRDDQAIRHGTLAVLLHLENACTPLGHNIDLVEGNRHDPVKIGHDHVSGLNPLSTDLQGQPDPTGSVLIGRG